MDIQEKLTNDIAGKDSNISLITFEKNKKGWLVEFKTGLPMFFDDIRDLIEWIDGEDLSE